MKEFDLRRYMGLWYEINRTFNNFEYDCKNASAFYTINVDNTVNVLNTCFDKHWKRISSIQGTAVQIKNNKFHVSFPQEHATGLLVPNYIVLKTDYVNYSIVTSQDKKYLWILSRNKTLDKELENKIYDFCERNGYKRKDFIR